MTVGIYCEKGLIRSSIMLINPLESFSLEGAECPAELLRDKVFDNGLCSFSMTFFLKVYSVHMPAVIVTTSLKKRLVNDKYINLPDNVRHKKVNANFLEHDT